MESTEFAVDLDIADIDFDDYDEGDESMPTAGPSTATQSSQDILSPVANKKRQKSDLFELGLLKVISTSTTGKTIACTTCR